MLSGRSSKKEAGDTRRLLARRQSVTAMEVCRPLSMRLRPARLTPDRFVLPPRLGFSAISRYQSANPSLGLTSTMVLKAAVLCSRRVHATFVRG